MFSSWVLPTVFDTITGYKSSGILFLLHILLYYFGMHIFKIVWRHLIWQLSLSNSWLFTQGNAGVCYDQYGFIVEFLAIHKEMLVSVMISMDGSETDRKWVNDISVQQEDNKMLLHNLCTTLIHLHLKKMHIYIF